MPNPEKIIRAKLLMMNLRCTMTWKQLILSPGISLYINSSRMLQEEKCHEKALGSR